MIFQIKAYLQFLIRSKNRHGVHSPFVYQFVENCLNDRAPYQAYQTLADANRQLATNKQLIRVTDHGAKSKTMHPKRRRVCDMAAVAGITPYRQKLLYRLARYFNIENALEIGTSVGKATVALAAANVRVQTIEGCTNTQAVAKDLLADYSDRIQFINGTFEAILPTINDHKFDLIFFDGNHQYEPTISYFNTLLPTAHAQSVWIFDDIYYSANMQSAWEVIRNDARVTLSIDTFRWGMVFFEPRPHKEHFVIRPPFFFDRTQWGF
jgi:predicted O-methyltransferase YrrM